MVGAAQSGSRDRYGELSAEGRRLVAEVAAELGDHLESARAAVNARVLVELPELDQAPLELHDGFDRSTRAHMALLRGMLGAWTDPSAAPAPKEAIDWGVDLARHGIPIETLLRAYRIGHGEFWQFWLKLLSARVDDPNLLAETSAATSDYTFRYVDAALVPIIDEYLRERERLARRAQSLGEAELRRVLRGDAVDIGLASERMRYRLDGWHIGFIVWSDAEDEVDVTPQLDRAGARVAEVLRGTESLVVPAGRSVLYGWVGSSRRRGGTTAHSEIDGMHVCVGSPGKGVAGFRRTHDQAGLARRVARLSTPVPAYLDYRDCAVAALLCADVDRAREFVAEVLGETLERDDADRLLETVSVYQHEGLSLSRAAERLHVHRNTVAYRVRRVVEASTENDGGSLHLRAAVELARLVGLVADGGHRRNP
ncbi:PucR family transcriptional regulator [Rhodococcus opacus]|uniref:Uncharacterized protein n=1 Tax=Rhodococcus opacus TaxID=37919 RepID=A0A076EQQ0_RHOOP|nr:helix-turn-helix domain-containing protein [Rhodococcus opacus]AII05759.1 hypothetical protein EP51_14620 [Rhodococcus opacus]